MNQDHHEKEQCINQQEHNYVKNEILWWNWWKNITVSKQCQLV